MQDPLPTPVRYGIIGSGMMGVEHIWNLAAIEGTRVVAVADPHEPSQEAARRAAVAAAEHFGGQSVELEVFADHRSLLERGVCDVVVIASPNMTHAAILLDVLAHARPHHILVEKPLCTTVADCHKVLAAAAKRPDVLVQVGLEYRYIPAVARVIREVRDGALGRVRMVAIREHRFPFLVKVHDWNRFSINSGGTLVEKCCHFFDLMGLIAGAAPVRVFASGGQDVNHLQEVYGGKVSDILDNAYVIVDYENGTRGMLDLCMFAEGSRNEQEISVVGNQGKCEGLVPESIVRTGKRANGRPGVVTVECHDPTVRYEGLHHGSSFLEHVDFLAALRSLGKGGPPGASLDEGLMSVAVGVAAHASIELGAPVKLIDVVEGRVTYSPPP